MGYLYGASIQGIQGFIFETNKLKEIVGASDLIERFCSLGFLDKYSKTYDITIDKSDVLRSAGGNIRIKFDNENDAKNMVLSFPKYIMDRAYGITISQAVESYVDEKYLDTVDALEQKLKYARNQALLPLDSKFSLMRQSNRTGKPAFTKNKDDEYLDKASFQKNSHAEESKITLLTEKLALADISEKFPMEMKDICNKSHKIAVIHADGNKMGLMLQKMIKDLKGETAEKIQDVFKTFSHKITEATNDAVKSAFDKNFNREENIIPFRPVVIGGDDVTVICSADNALGFTKDYLSAFEENTQAYFAANDLSQYAEKLTACAGIAYCNEKFPFHYAVDLAEALCGYAKEESNREASCLIFHNIQSSYFTDYKSYVANELSTKENVSLQYGPYYTNRQPSIDAIHALYMSFTQDGVPTGKFRAWLSEVHKNKEYATLYLERISAMLDAESKKSLDAALKKLDDDLGITTLINTANKTPMHDVMQLKSVLVRSR